MTLESSMRLCFRFLHVALTSVLSLSALCISAQTAGSRTYTNPLSLKDPKTGPVVSCPDPAIIKQTVDSHDTWYLYCTGDPLNSNDKDANGNLKNHLITSFRSSDLIHWTYIGDVLKSLPAWIGNINTNLWAPAIKYFNTKYYLYYVAPLPGYRYAIGVATSASPAGPWVDSGHAVVPPEPNPYNPSSPRAVIDPDVIEDDFGQRYISYGSFGGGIAIRKLSPDGLTSDASPEQEIAIDNMYEGASFWKHDGYYYLFLSTSSCCDGPLSGYSVFVGRALQPTGPFVDKNGVPLLSFAPGGFISMAANGNMWVGDRKTVPGRTTCCITRLISSGPIFRDIPASLGGPR
jgi:arabinan endo-1,5-alpha-L-arabinosidase